MDCSRKYPKSGMCRQPLLQSCMDRSRKYPESGMCQQPLLQSYSAWIVLGNTLNQGCVDNYFSIAISAWITLGNTLNNEYVNRIVSFRTICGVFMTIVGKADKIPFIIYIFSAYKTILVR